MTTPAPHPPALDVEALLDALSTVTLVLFPGAHAVNLARRVNPDPHTGTCWGCTVTLRDGETQVLGVGDTIRDAAHRALKALHHEFGVQQNALQDANRAFDLARAILVGKTP